MLGGGTYIALKTWGGGIVEVVINESTHSNDLGVISKVRLLYYTKHEPTFLSQLTHIT